jgi:hypothetical protein
MCGRARQSTTPPHSPPQPPGPIDDRFAYRVTEEGLKALAEYELANGKPAFTKAPFSAATSRAPETEAWRERKRRRWKKAPDRGLRFFTVCGRWRRGRKIPDLRLTGQWLEAAGFPLGQEIEVEVEAGRLTLRAI